MAGQAVVNSGQVLAIHVDGMSCGRCLFSVQSALRGVPGVCGAAVNLATHTALVESNSNLSFEAIVRQLKSHGYDATRLDCRVGLPADFRRQPEAVRQSRQGIIQSLFMYALPVLALEWLGPVLSSSQPGHHVWWRVLQALLCAMALWSPAGGPVLYGGLRAFLFRTPSADLLISAALVVAYVSSLMAILSSAPRLHYFHAVVMILVFVNLGRYLEARAGGRVSKAVDALFSRLPPSVTLLTAGRPQEAALETVARGDILSVAADEFIPVDGRILAGQATVDESVLFGGASAVVRRSGDPVLAGTFLLDGSLTVEASASATQSSWGQVMTTVYKAQSTRTRLQSVADGLAQWLVVVVLGVALTTAVAWGLWGQNGSIGVARAVAVLAIACPCAFGLATPAALYIASARAALHGIVVQDASAFEQLGLPHTRWEARAGSAAGSVIIRTPVDQSAVKPSSDLPGERLDPAADAVALARRTRRIMLQNLLWALSYNVAAIPLAAVGAIPAWVAPGFMMSSRLVAVFNALRLRRVSWTGGASLR